MRRIQQNEIQKEPTDKFIEKYEKDTINKRLKLYK